MALPKSPKLSAKPHFKPQTKRLMDQVREVLRYHHYALRTDSAYVRWILACIRYHGRQHSKDMGKTALMSGLMFGGGWCLMEGFRMRVHDLFSS